MDRQLREKQRMAQAGDEVACVGLLRSRIRAGDLRFDRALLAADAGHPQAGAALGREARAVSRSVTDAMGVLLRHDWSLCLCAAVQGVGRVLPFHEKLYGPGDARPAFELLCQSLSTDCVMSEEEIAAQEC